MFRYLVPFLWALTLSSYTSLAHATLDAVFANASDEPNRVCLGDGTGRFTCTDVSADTNSSFGVALGDVNGDSFLDAVFANAAEPNRVCLGDGTGRFTCTDVSPDTNLNLSEGVALGDVNGDTFLDAVFANIGFSPGPFVPGAVNRVCLGDGTGRFTCSGVSPDRNVSEGVALGDVNGDTFLDAVFANSGGFIIGGLNRVCLGDGTGRFTCTDVSPDTNRSEGVALGDVNSDSFLDAVFVNMTVLQPNKVCLGDGTGHFTCSDVSADRNSSRGVALGEVDKAVVIAPTTISVPALSLWTWFLLSILLAGMAMIMLRTIR